MARKFCTRTILVYLTSLSLLIGACTPATAPTQYQASQPATAVSTQTPTATRIPTETPTAQVMPSPTPTQEAISFLPTTFEQPGAWNLRHPYTDPEAPELIAAAEDGYALNQDFQVASIELSYRWIGIGPTVHNYQRIAWRDGGFWKNDQQISSEAVDKLVQAIAHLRPIPQTLSIIVWSDDYPFWAVEVTSVNGNKILLYSDSNASSYIPWNVIFNGEIYAQFDGAIPTALDGLFTVFEDRAIAFTCGCEIESDLPIATYEAPPAQISEGFNGLLPVYHDFSYFADPQIGEVRGYLSGESWVDQVGEAEINWLTGLQAIDLEIGTDQTVSCRLENGPMDDPVFVYWKFSCPVGEPLGRISYRYPIKLTYATSTGQPYALPGELFGYWQESATIPVIPYSSEIGEILESSPVASDLLNDHLMYVVDFYGSADATTGVMTREWDANVVLLGQVQFGERIVPYTVKLDEVRIQDGKLVYWDLSRTNLQDLLKEVLSQTVTRRFLEYDPQGVINLYYAEYTEYSIIRSDDLPACAYLPQGPELPSPGKPLRGFSFNLPLGSVFYSAQIIFTDAGLRIFQLDLKPDSPRDAYWISVLPEALMPQTAPPFKAIGTRMGSPDINVEWDEQTSPSDVSYYESMFTGWDVVRLTEFMQGLRLNQRWYDLTPDGGLILVNCLAP